MAMVEMTLILISSKAGVDECAVCLNNEERQQQQRTMKTNGWSEHYRSYTPLINKATGAEQLEEMIDGPDERSKA